jgi:hypothetical protein
MNSYRADVVGGMLRAGKLGNESTEKIETDGAGFSTARSGFGHKEAAGA